VRILAILGVIVTFPSTASAYKDESVAEIIARAQAAPAGEQPALYIKAAQRQLKTANQLYDEGKVDEARAAVEELVAYSDKATEASSRSRKRLKNTEIEIRKMAEKLRHLKRTLNFDDQAPVQAAADRLEEMRTKLLSLMFSKEKK
jgi:hypothetical protein